MRILALAVLAIGVASAAAPANHSNVIARPQRAAPRRAIGGRSVMMSSSGRDVPAPPRSVRNVSRLAAPFRAPVSTSYF